MPLASMYSASVVSPSVTTDPVFESLAWMQTVRPASSTMEPSDVSTLLSAGSL